MRRGWAHGRGARAGVLVRVAGAAFALVVTTPHPAFAASSTTDQPFVGSGRGTVRIPVVGARTFVFSGSVSADPLGNGTFDGSGSMDADARSFSVRARITATNGRDSLDVSGAGLGSPTRGTFRETLVFTGGTGRFAGALGTFTLTGEAAPTADPTRSTFSFDALGGIHYTKTSSGIDWAAVGSVAAAVGSVVALAGLVLLVIGAFQVKRQLGEAQRQLGEAQRSRSTQLFTDLSRRWDEDTLMASRQALRAEQTSQGYARFCERERKRYDALPAHQVDVLRAIQQRRMAALVAGYRRRGRSPDEATTFAEERLGKEIEWEKFSRFLTQQLDSYHRHNDPKYFELQRVPNFFEDLAVMVIDLKALDQELVYQSLRSACLGHYTYWSSYYRGTGTYENFAKLARRLANDQEQRSEGEPSQWADDRPGGRSS